MNFKLKFFIGFLFGFFILFSPVNVSYADEVCGVYHICGHNLDYDWCEDSDYVTCGGGYHCVEVTGRSCDNYGASEYCGSDWHCEADDVEPPAPVCEDGNATNYGGSLPCQYDYAECSDGIDNDNDGTIDYPADYFCTDPGDDDERDPVPQCSDGTDNDGDGYIDYPADFGCANGQDNDENGGVYSVDGACSATHYNCSEGVLGATAEYSTEWQWWCNGTNGGSNLLCSELKNTMSGANCTIAQGASSCTTTLSWTVPNPEIVLGSAITSNTNNSGVSSANFSVVNPTTVSTGNFDSGTKTSVTIPYPSRTFYLYNNAKSVYPTSPNGSGLVVTASCVSGTSWNGSACASVAASPLTVDLKVDGGDYSTAETALSVEPGDTLSFSWSSAGHSTRNCWTTGGVSGDGWALGSVAQSNTNQNITASMTMGLNSYTLHCRHDSELSTNLFQKIIAFLNPFEEADAATFVTVSDTVWVNVSNIACGSDGDCTCTSAECRCESGCSIIYSWTCLPPATVSVGIGFNTDLDNDGFGDLSGTVTLSPSADTNYGHVCNGGSVCLDSDDCSTPIDVIKKPFYIEN